MLPNVLKNSSENLINEGNVMSTRISLSYFSLYILMGVTIVMNLGWYFGTLAYRSINLGG